MSLSALRKANQDVLAKLKQSDTPQQTNDKSRFEDKRLWKPTFDKEKGIGSATIRFMPACEAELGELPYAKIFSHAFQGSTGKWYIEKSLSTIGKKDVLSQLNQRLWNSGVESDKEVARGMKRKTTYFANVLIIKDSAHPELEGKVMLYEYGPAIANLIKNAAFPPPPEFEDDAVVDPMNAFDVFEGADLVIKMVGKKLKNYKGEDVLVPDYERTAFREPAPLFGGDEDKIEAVWKQCHPLKPFTAEDQFKTNAQLSKRLIEVLGSHAGSGVVTVDLTDTGDTAVEPDAKPTKPKAPTKPKTPTVPQVDASDDGDLDFLMGLDS